MGELVIDATASPDHGTKSILLIHYPHSILVCRKNIENVEKHFGINEKFQEFKNWEPFKGYDHNLFMPKTANHYMNSKLEA